MQDVFLDGRADPPHRVGRKAEPAVGVEFLRCLHQPDIPFGDQIGDRQAVSCKTSGDFDHQAQMAADEFTQGGFVAMITPRKSKFLFTLRAQHREPLRVGHKVGERVAPIFDHVRHCHLSYAPAKRKTAPLENLREFGRGIAAEGDLAPSARDI